MSQNADMMKLYSKRILALAAEIPLTERLDAPDATARKRSPLCGSTVTVDINLKNGAISEFGQDVKACALGQAAASIIAQNVIGRTQEEIQTGRDQLKGMLTDEADPPSDPFTELETLLPAKDYKNRHASILLTFDALLAACEEAPASTS